MASFNVDEVKSAPVGASPRNVSLVDKNDIQNKVSYEEIASKLLSERMLLTALELHAELCETDRELPILRDFFTNPNNFECLNMKSEASFSLPRSSSQATLDSLDMTRFSEDGGGIDERNAVLEFELRKAKDTINSLRANLTVVTESEVSTPDKNSEKGIFEHPIKPHEQRALNCLVYEYLLARSYKLTSITFSDENEDQNLEDWQDVGLNIPKPVELLQVYREFMRSTGYDKPPSNDAVTQTDDNYFVDKEKMENLNKIVDEQIEEIERLKEKTITLEQEKMNLLTINTNVEEHKGSSGTIQTLNSSSTTTPDKFEMLETPALQDIIPSVSTTTMTTNVVRDDNEENSVQEEDDSTSMVVSIGETETSERDWTRIHFTRSSDLPDDNKTITGINAPSRYIPENFRHEVLKRCAIKPPDCATQIIEEPLKDGVTRDNLPDIASHTLPRIIPNVILNRREEVIPLLLSVVKLQSNSVDRDKLLQILFNLQKRPQDDERHMILAGLTAIANLEKEPTDNEEVLNLCWEQSQHKYTERRLLAAECCSALAIYTTSSVRNSLMISMLQQMLLDDKEPIVRVTVVKSLGLLVAMMDDPDKYFQCEELALTAMDDQSPEVVEAASTVLIPILAQWALTLKRLQTHLVSRIFTKLKNLLKATNSPTKDYLDNNRAAALMIVLRYLLPHTVISVVDTETVRKRMQESLSSQLPLEFTNLCCFQILDPKNFYECDVDMGVLLNTFFLNSWDDYVWTELTWLCDKLILDLTEITQNVTLSQENIIQEFLTYLQSFCLGFGKFITQRKVLVAFKLLIENIETELMNPDVNQKLTHPLVIPAYLAILSTLDSNEFMNSLKHYLVTLSMRGENLNGLRIVVVKFCGQEKLQEYVLSSLWDGVVHHESIVKCATASLFSAILSKVSNKLVDIRIAPAIVTLASDSDVNVKSAAIQVLGKLVTDSNAKEAKDKARLTLETIVRDPQGIPAGLIVSLVLTLAIVTPHCPQNFVEDVIATQLPGITASAIQQNRSVDLTNALVEAYSVLVYCNLSNQCITNNILPGLKYLDSLVNLVVPQQKKAVHLLLREIESRTTTNNIDRSASVGSGLSLSSMASGNVAQGVEDMRQRVSKMFHQKTSSPSMPNIFRKKKG